jgi:hypothetical protein
LLFRLDEKVAVDAIYLDFQKVFDSVPHKKTLKQSKGLLGKREGMKIIG